MKQLMTILTKMKTFRNRVFSTILEAIMKAGSNRVLFTLRGTMAAAMVILFALAAPAAFAGTLHWTGGYTGANGSTWQNASNWGGTAWVNGSDVIFENSNINNTPATYLGAARTVNSITFASNAAGAFTVRLATTKTGGTAATLTFIAGNTGIDVQAGDAYDHTIGVSDGSVVLAGDLAVNHNGSGTLTINRPITGGFALTKDGTGTFVLSGANTYSGGTTISGGTLQLSGAGTINSSSGITIDGGGAKFLHAGSTAVSPTVTLTQGTLTGSGTVNTVVVGAGTGGVISNNNGVAGAALTVGSLTFDGAATVNAFVNSTSAAIVTTSLATNAAGTVTVNPSAASWTVGETYNLISYGGGSIGGAGFGQFALGTVSGITGRQSANFGNSGTAITLAITGDAPRWVGDGDGKWNLASASNWKLITAGTYTTFMANDKVLFDDNATGAGPISVDIDAADVATFATIFDNSTKDYVLGGSGGFGISSGSLSKSGAGTVTITTVNAYTGATTINAGTLQIAGAGSLGSGAYGGGITNDGVFRYSSSAAQTLSGAITGAGSLVKDTGAGILTLTSANNSYTGATTVSGGTLQIGGSGRLGGGSYAGDISIANGTTLDYSSSAAQTLSGVISGQGALVMSGSGNLTLSGDNTGFTGGSLNVDAGTLRGTNLNAFGSIANSNTINLGATSGTDNAILNYGLTGTWIATPINVRAGSSGTRTIQSSADTPNVTGAITLANDLTLALASNSITLSGGITGTGNVNIAGTGAKTLTIQTAALGYTGNLTNSFTGTGAGVVTISAPVNITGLITNNSAGTGTMTFSGIIGANVTGVVQNSATSVLNLSGANTYTGATTISAGTLRVGVDSVGSVGSITSSAIGTGGLTFSGGGLSSDGATPRTILNAVTFGGNATLGDAVNNGKLTFSANASLTGTRTLTVNSEAQFDGIISSTGAYGITKAGAGTLTLSGVSTYTGATTVSGGTLEIGGAGQLGGGTYAAAIAIADGATFKYNSTAAQTLSGDISGGGALTKTGAGNLTISGANTYTGATTVNAGTLQLDYTTNNTSKIDDLAVLTLGGGTVDLSGGSHTEVVASTTLAAGASNVTRTSGAAVLAMNTINPIGGMVNFGAGSIATTTNSNDNGGILGAWATIGDDWASNDGSGNIVAYTAGYADIDARGGTIADDSTTNVRILGDGTSGNIELGATTTTVNTLWQINADYAATVNTAGKTLKTGGIRINSGKEAMTIGAAANDGTLTAAAAGGSLLLLNGSAGKTLTINAVIGDNSSASSLTTTGDVVLNGDNTYTGATFVGGGSTLAVGGSGTLGGGTYTGATSIGAGATFTYNSSATQTFSGTIADDGTLMVLGVGDATFSGVISGAGGLTLGVNGGTTYSGIAALTTANTFTGGVTLNSGTLKANGTGAALGAGVLVLNGGTLDFNDTKMRNFGRATTVGGDATIISEKNVAGDGVKYTLGTLSIGANTLNIAGGNVTGGTAEVVFGAATLTGAATFNITNPVGGGTTLLTISGAVDNGGNLLTVDGSGSTTFGVINQDAVSLTGAGGVTKNGSGRLSLGGVNNSYNGTTTLNGGVTIVTTDASIGTGNLTLNGGVFEHYWNDAFVRTLGAGAGQVQITGGTSGFSENGKTSMNVTINNSAGYEVVWGAANEAGNANATGYFNPSTLVLQAASAQAGSNLNFQNKIDLNGDSRSVMVKGTNSGVVATISGDIRNSSGTTPAGLTKTGPGLLVLSGTNTYDGGTTISDGRLRFASLVSMPPSGDVAVNTGTTLVVPIGGTGQWTTGTSGNGTIGGLLAGLGGQSGGTVSYSGAASLDFETTGTQDYTGDIGNVGTSLGITKSGAGTLTLSGNNGYLGETTVSAGTLVVSGSSSTSGVTLNAATLVIGNNAALGAGTLTIAGAGTVRAAGTIVTTTSAVAANSNFTIEGTDALTLGGTMTLSAARTITNNNTTSATTFGGISGSDTALTLSGNGSTTVTGAIALGSGGLVKNGTGTLTLSGADGTYTGVTNIAAGTVIVSKLADGGQPSSIGASANTSTNLLLGNGTALKYIGAGDNTDRQFRFNGNLAGLSITLDASGAGPINFTSATGPSHSNANQTRTLNLIGSNTGENTLAANIGNNGTAALGVVKGGEGTWVLSGANAYTGATTVSGGTLLVNGSLAAASAVTVNTGGTLGGTGTIGGAVTVNGGGTLAPGAGPGTLTVNSSLEMEASSTYVWQLGSDSLARIVDVNGILSISTWTLKLVDLGGVLASAYDLFTYETFSGAFTLPTIDYGTTGWSGATVGLDPVDKRVVLKFGLPGDTNGDRVVDAADFITLKKNFGSGAGAGPEVGNFDKTGTVDWADLGILMSNMGAGGGAPATAPEPCSAILLIFGAAALLRRRRKA
jgi:autotransporter-associated beta strand protein